MSILYSKTGSIRGLKTNWSLVPVFQVLLSREFTAPAEKAIHLLTFVYQPRVMNYITKLCQALPTKQVLTEGPQSPESCPKKPLNPGAELMNASRAITRVSKDSE